MKLIIGIVILLVAVLAFLRWRSRTGVHKEAGKPALTASGRLKPEFHAVSIRPGVSACKAARELEGQRFLSAHAPRIPLAKCDAADCSCRFAHHDDRRAGDDRRTPYRSSIGLDPGSTGVDQRALTERRRSERDLD